MAIYTEYKVIKIQESALGALAGGGSGVPASKMEAELNQHVASGWQVVFQVVEARRSLFGTEKIEIIITLGRE